MTIVDSTTAKHTKDSLIRDLQTAGVDPLGTLWLHLSLKAVGDIDGGGETLVSALMEYMKDGLLVIPTHTWATVNKENPNYDISETPSCIGILPDLFRKRDGVHRSLHPTHSIAAFGQDAKSFVANQERFKTPCAPESSYGELMKRNAHVLLIGVDFARNTMIHCIEEIADIPKRLDNEPEYLTCTDWDGQVYETPQNRHIGRISENYTRMEARFYERGFMKDVYIGSAKTMSFKAADLRDVTLELLDNDPHIFDDIE